MNKKRILLALGLAICLSGCSGNNPEPGQAAGSVVPPVQSEEMVSASTETVQGETKQEAAAQETEKIPVNTAEEAGAMNWNGERLSRASACLGNKIYFSQWAREGRESILYEMNIGEASLRQSALEIPEGMEIQALAADDTGHLHLLLRTAPGDSETFTSIIRELDADGNTVNDVDISEAIGKRYTLWQAFVVDSEGNYYIKDLDYMMCISREGKSLWEMDNRSMGIGRSYAAAVANGVVYMSYQKDDITYIGEINPADGTLPEEYPLAEIESTDPILVMGQGTDSELLLYGSSSGVWAWNSDENRLENRGEASEANLPYNETIVLRRFLSDGRLLLVKNLSEGNELTGMTYQYLPGGK